MQTVLLTRDSVHPGDDLDAPHIRCVTLTGETPQQLIEEILKLGYLPSIVGGKASWVVGSHKPFAVCAQQWNAPRMIGAPLTIADLRSDSGAARLHFSYIGHATPEVVFDVLWHCKFDLPDVGGPPPA